MTTRSFVVVLLVVCCSLTFANETGDLWESTAEMAVPGGGSFTMPAMKSCRPHGEWNEPPTPPGDTDCEMSDVHRAGGTITWKVTCTKPPATGTGKMEFDGADSYRGTMTMSSDQGEMVMKMSGRRIGECDLDSYQTELGGMGKSINVDQINKAVADAQALQSATLAKMCMDGARAGQAFYFVGPGAMCTEPQHKEAFCAALLTEEGYEGLLALDGMGGVTSDEAIRFCGKEPDALRLEVCDNALGANSLVFVDKHCPERSDQICAKALELEVLELLNDRCPAQAGELAQRECSGRQYSSMIGTKYRGFCSQYAASEMKADGEEPQATVEEDAKKKTVGKVKKGLKGLFQR